MAKQTEKDIESTKQQSIDQKLKDKIKFQETKEEIKKIKGLSKERKLSDKAILTDALKVEDEGHTEIVEKTEIEENKERDQLAKDLEKKTSSIKDEDKKAEAESAHNIKMGEVTKKYLELNKEEKTRHETAKKQIKSD
jgi:hypothetical protein